MEDLRPWYSLAEVKRVLDAAGEGGTREWLRANWSREFLGADPAVVRRLLPLLDLPHTRDRAALVLYAVDRDWVEALEAAADPACGFLPAFWRDAFERARRAGSVQCVAWLLANRGDAVAGLQDDGLDL